MKDRYYFAYGSNMNLEQMKYRCPAAEVVENVRLENYRLAFRGRAPPPGRWGAAPQPRAGRRRISEWCVSRLGSSYYNVFTV